MKKVVKIVSICLALICFMGVFSGCSKQKELKKVSKNLSSYDISVEYCEEDKSLIASQEVVYVNSTDVMLDNICFNFYPRAFREESEIRPYTQKNFAKVFPNGEDYGNGKIISVRVNDQESSFSYVNQSSTAICIKLDKALEPKQKVNIKLDFNVELANCTHRLGYYNGSVSLGNFFPIIAVYEKGEFVTSPYYSTGDPFYSELANYNVKIKFPEKYEMVSTGRVVKKETGENFKIYTISGVAVRDFAVSLVQNVKTVYKTIEKTQISYTGYENDSDFDENLQTAVDCFEFFSKTFGAYPYSDLCVVKMPFVHGGMEYPNMVVISDSISGEFDKAKVIVHEIAHQWWYGIVGNNQIKEAWLDESLAEYSTVLFFENYKKYDVSYEELISDAFSVYTLYADIVKTTLGDIKTSMLLPVNEYSSEYEYSYMIYVKGVLMFDAIREVVGKKKLNECFKKYFSAYKFKTATTDSLIASFRKTSGKDIEGVFDSWLSGRVVIGTI